MSTVIDGWTFHDIHNHVESCFGERLGKISAWAHGKDLSFTIQTSSDGYGNGGIIPNKVLAELLRRAGWKVEAP